MELRQINHIRKNLTELLKNTFCTELLLAHFLQNNILSEEDVQKVKCQPTELQKSGQLYEIIKTKIGSYAVLIAALDAERQTGALEIIKRLSPALTDEQKLKKLLALDLPSSPAFYISRKLVPTNVVSTDVFVSSSSDVFVVSDIRQNILKEITNDQLTATSSDVVRSKRTLARFIVLVTVPHFKVISKLARQKDNNVSVHWLHFQHHGNLLLHVISEGNLAIIQNHFLPQIQHEKYPQDSMFDSWLGDSFNFRKKLDPSPIILSDSPGMGKTSLVAYLANNFDEEDNRVVLFATMYNVIIAFDQTINLEESNDESWLNALSTQFCKNETESVQSLFIEMVRKKDLQIELMLDGFDELHSSMINRGISVIKRLHQGLPNIRLWITTRPHYKNMLENALGHCGYNIWPFDKTNQKDFLVQFWRHKTPSFEEHQITQFAEKILEKLSRQMTDVEKDFAGIPLQCMLIAEAFSNHLEDNSPENTFSESKEIPDVDSIVDLYDLLVEKKFSIGISKQNMDKNVTKKMFYKWHEFEAIKLIFPRWVHKLDLVEGNKQIMISFGLIESSGSDRIAFLHRTFAEYFIAKFVADFNKTDGSQNLTEFVATEILQFRSLTDQVFQFEYPVICYFINHFMSKHEESVAPILIENQVIKVTSEEAYSTLLNACCQICANQQLLHLLKLFEENNIASFYIREENRKMLFEAISSSRNSTDFVEFLVKKIRATGVSLETITLDDETVIHVASRAGNFTIFDYLSNQGEFSALINSDSHDILHCCVSYSIQNPEEIIKGKEQIIDYFGNKNLSSVYTPNKLNAIPLHCPGVHVTLIEKMMSYYFDANKKTEAGDTLLHVHAEYLSPQHYQELLLALTPDQLKSLIHVKGFNNHTPLHRVIIKQKTSLDTCKFFLENEADPNSINLEQESILGSAIKTHQTLELVQLLIDKRADVGYINTKYQQSLIHLAVESCNVNALELLLQTKQISLDIHDAQNNTALNIALARTHPKQAEMFKLLHDYGADVSEEILLNMLPTLNLDTYSVLKENEKGNGSKKLSLTYNFEYLFCTSVFTKELSSQDEIFSGKAETDWVTDKDCVARIAGNAVRKNDAQLLSTFPKEAKEFLTSVPMELGLLHYGVRYGNHSVVQQLLHPSFGFSQNLEKSNMQNLLHFCLAETANEEIKSIQDKARTVTLLLKMKQSFSKESGRFKPSHMNGLPMFVPSVHASLIEEILKIDKKLINETDLESGRNIVHHIASSTSSDQFQNIVEIVELNKATILFKDIDKTGNTPMHLAVANFDVIKTTLEILQKYGVDFNAVNNDAKSILLVAIESIRTETFIERLLAFGANCNTVFQDGQTNLHVAVRGGVLSHVTSLLKLKCEVNAQNQCGHTPLHTLFLDTAASSDSLFEITSALLDHEANPKVEDQCGNTPAHYLCSKVHPNFLNVLKLLVDAGGDLFARNYEYKTVLHLAAIHLPPNDFQDLASFLVDSGYKAVLHLQDRNGCTALHYIVASMTKLSDFDPSQIFDFLCKNDVNFNAIDNFGNTAAMYAALTSVAKLSMFECLKRFKSDLLVKNLNSVNLLHIGAYLKYVELLTKLVGSVADFDPKHFNDLHENNPLHFIFMNPKGLGSYVGNHIASVANFHANHLSEQTKHTLHFLLNCGFDINASNLQGQTPLHFAAQSEIFEEIFETIDLKHINPDFNAVDINGQSLMCYALRNQMPITPNVNTFMASLIRVRKYPDTASNLYSALVKGRANVCEQYTKQGYHVNVPDEYGNTLLHHAVKSLSNDRAIIVQILLENGGDPNLLNSNLESVLELCIRKVIYAGNDQRKIDSSIIIINMLIQHKADLIKLDSKGTPLVFSLATYLENVDFHKVAQAFENKYFDQILCIRGHFEENLLHKLIASNNPLDITINLTYVRKCAKKSDKFGNTPIFYAVINHASYRVLSTLVELLDVDVSLVNGEKSTLLHAAVQYENYEALTVLLPLCREHVKAKDNYGKTPVQYVNSNSLKCKETYQLLEFYGADISTNNLTKDSEADWQFLQDLVAKYTSGLLLKDENIISRIDTLIKQIDYLVQEQYYEECIDVNGKTVCHIAAKCLTLIEYHTLIKHLVDMKYFNALNADDKNGCNLLHDAVKYLDLQSETVNLFNEAIRVNKVNHDGHNVLHQSILSGRSTALIDNLIHRNNIDVKDKRGKTPLDLAKALGNSNYVELLERNLLIKQNENQTIPNTSNLHQFLKKKLKEVAKNIPTKL